MQSINLQIAPGSVNPVINVSQNDVGRQFQLKLYDGAAAYTLPTGTTASIEGIKPDGHAFSYSDAVSVSGSILTVTTKLQMTVVAGRVICEIRLRKSGLDLGSLNFVMLVEESPINENVDPSDTEIPAIIELAEGQVEDAEAWARGTKNGEPVASTDPQFQNNAKWYAEHVAASLDALSNVDISSPVNEDVLEYNSTTQEWKNSGAVRQLKQALSDEVTTRAALGAHNLFDIETWLNSVNLTYTVNNDVYTTSTGGTSYGSPFIFSDKDIDVELSGVITNTTSGNVRFDLLDSNNSVVGTLNSSTSSVSGKGCKVRMNWSTAGNFTIEKPMIRLATDSDPTYQPYAMTNRELTDVAEQLDGKYIVDANKKVSVTANGTKTYAELLAELYTAYKIISDATANDFLRITDLYIGGYDNFIPSRLLQTNTTLGIPSVLRFETVLGDAAQVITHYVTFGASSATVRMTVVAATASGNSITAKNEEVPTSGKIITITYDLYKKIS